LEAGTVPANNGLWAHNNQGLFPSRPVPLRKNPEELVKRGEARSGVLALQHGQLLPKGKVFEPEVPVRAEKANNRGQ
jgi:hypothetical protein